MVRDGRHSSSLGSLPPPPAGYSLSPSLLFPGSFSLGKNSFRFSQDRTKKGFEVPRGIRQHPDLPFSLHPQDLSVSPVFSSYKHPLSITLAHTIVQLSTSSCSLQSRALKWFRAPPRKAGGKVSGVSEPAFAAGTYLAVVGSVQQRGEQSRRLPAVVTTQPLLSYTWCLLEGGKQFWALTAFFLSWRLFRALQSKHDYVWLVAK